MPLDLGAVNAVNAVLFVPGASVWRVRVARWLTSTGAVPATVDLWLDVLERRAAGGHDWASVLAGGAFADGRPMPPVRRYNDALAGAPGLLPTWHGRGLPFVLDVWGPGARGGEPGTVGLEILVHRGTLQPADAPAADPVGYAARRTVLGDAFADLMADACEALAPVYALSDGMQPVGDFLDRATPDRVRHAAPGEARLADYAWALSYWSPERLDDALAARLARVTTPPAPPAAPEVADGVEVSVRTLATGGTFLRARRILGAEHRASRARLETPLAKQLGLRSNHLLYRT